MLTYAARATAVVVNLGTDSATDVAAFSGIESFVGSTAATDTLTGEDDSNVWTVNGAGSGNVDGIQFTGFEELIGGSDADTFDIDASLLGSNSVFSGGAGDDTFNLV